MRGANTGDGADGNCAPSPIADGGCYHVYRDGRPASETVIDAVAAIRDLDPTTTRIPLDECVDPDALDAIFRDTHGGVRRRNGHVAFTLFDLDVFVHANGHVFVRDVRGDSLSSD